MKRFEVKLKNGMAEGYEIKLPNTSLVFVLAKQGYVMCGYLNMATADKMGDAAAIVRGVTTVNELLKAKIQEVSVIAKQLGIEIGMSGETALEKML
ncbi:MAG: DUF1805 domain-containing protein [bacterium]|nr:DUF1805 domain-containing protein [bacterium]MDD5354342.1 DUF1805 domain-containing protein [bacterium]MDD5757071.1 DUF1805 domain-containing protein [bacterium]